MVKLLEDAINQAVSTGRQLDFANQGIYALWLSQAYYFVRHSTPLLAISCGRAINNQPYHLRCISHLTEERGHDKLLINDLKAMGFKTEDFLELPSTQALYQTQYYWIEHVNPVSFLGYVFILEGLAVKLGDIKMKEVKNVKATSFLNLHSDEDVGHLESAFNQLKVMSKHDQECILKNAQLTAGLYCNMITEIQAYSMRSQVKVA